jgi:hypothetical protein
MELGFSWPEDFAHENGNYQCLCCHCGVIFYGHKRRVTCKRCSLAVPQNPDYRFEHLSEAPIG